MRVCPRPRTPATPASTCARWSRRRWLASKHGLTLANAPGLIDAGYRGEVIVAVVNLDREQAVTIEAGDRIAQLVVVALPDVSPRFVQELPDSARGEGGFGSSGTS